MFQKYFFIASVFFISGLFAEEPLFPSIEKEMCVQSILRISFPENLVREALDAYDVDPKTQDKIVESLKNKENDVRKRFSEKQKNIMELFQDAAKRKEAAKKFQDTAFEVFNEVAIDAGLKDTDENQKIFYLFQQKKAEQFAKCLQDRKKATSG